MSWQFHRNVPNEDILKAADSSISARDASIRRPAEHVFVIPDEVYEHMKQRKAQRTNWDLINLQEIRRRDTSTLVILLQLLEEKFRSFTDDGKLFERVALGLCKSIPKDFLMHCFLDSISLDNDPGRQSFYQTNLESFGQNELSSWYKSSDLYNVLKAMNQKVKLFVPNGPTGCCLTTRANRLPEITLGHHRRQAPAGLGGDRGCPGASRSPPNNTALARGSAEKENPY